MTSRLLIEGGPHETRVALFEAGRLVEVQIERPEARSPVGNLYKGRVSRVVPGIEAAFVDIGLARDAFLFIGDARTRSDEVEHEQSITDLVKAGDEIVTQVIKEPLPNKGARVSTQVTWPGRAVVLIPGGDAVGISRRISDPEERQRLASELESLRGERQGVIARTVAAGRTRDQLATELQRLTEEWDALQQRGAACGAPKLIHQEPDLALRAIRDLVDDTVDEVLVADKPTHEQIQTYLGEVEPELLARLELHTGEPDLFFAAGVDREVERALHSRVWLDSGGFIVIHPTEALVAIDVNTGRFTGDSNLEATALQTNLEAAEEAARQIRLRDLGGIIVVDFIDLQEPENRQRVLESFESALQRDRTRTQLSEVSTFGLVEVTRKRARASLQGNLTQSCPCCRGRGRVKSPMSVSQEVRRELSRRSTVVAGGEVVLHLHPQVVLFLEGAGQSVHDELVSACGAEPKLVTDDKLRPDEFVIE